MRRDVRGIECKRGKDEIRKIQEIILQGGKRDQSFKNGLVNSIVISVFNNSVIFLVILFFLIFVDVGLG